MANLKKNTKLPIVSNDELGDLCEAYNQVQELNVNKDRLLDRTLKKLDAGLIDIEEAIREINPDEDEETIQSKIQKAKEQQALAMLAAQNEMNAEGEFGNNYDDLGGENLKGSTSPLQ